MIDNLKRNWYLLCAKWKYRKQGYNEVCCCGNTFVVRFMTVKNCPDYHCISRCAKEYAITCYVEEKMK